jgi:heat shock protein HslJ
MRPTLAAIALGASTIILGLSLGGCAMSDSGSTSVRAPSGVDALEGDWTLVMIESDEVGDPASKQMRRAPNITIADDGAAGGFAGVNRFSTRLTVGADGKASFGPAAVTKMAGPPEAMSFEDRYLRLLDSITGVRVGAERLVFLDGDREILRFVRAE